MRIGKLVHASLLLATIFSTISSIESSAQQPSENRLKEIQLGADSFTVADPVPSWVAPASLGEVDIAKPQPVVLRLADTQLLAGPVPATFVRRALLINDASSLTAAGRTSISFSPEYERVAIHSIRIIRGQTELDKTATSNIRFLRREQGLEQGVYSGRVTASILIDDLRVGDTLDLSYSTYGQNPVFSGKYIDSSAWDQFHPTLYRRVILNHPLDRHISWRMIGDGRAQPVTPKETVEGNIRKIEFEQRSMPATVIEPQVSPDFFRPRFIQFSESRAGTKSRSGRARCSHRRVLPQPILSRC